VGWKTNEPRTSPTLHASSVGLAARDAGPWSAARMVRGKAVEHQKSRGPIWPTARAPSGRRSCRLRLARDGHRSPAIHCADGRRGASEEVLHRHLLEPPPMRAGRGRATCRASRQSRGRGRRVSIRGRSSLWREQSVDQAGHLLAVHSCGDSTGRSSPDLLAAHSLGDWGASEWTEMAPGCSPASPGRTEPQDGPGARTCVDATTGVEIAPTVARTVVRSGGPGLRRRTGVARQRGTRRARTS